MNKHHILLISKLGYIDLLRFPFYGTIYRMKIKMCLTCHEEFTENKRKPQKYCSPTCYHISRQTRIPLDCPNCGKQFLISKRDYTTAKNKNRSCCSHKCRSALNSTTKTCPICEKKFSVSNALSNQKYCSRECFYNSHRAKKICPG